MLQCVVATKTSVINEAHVVLFFLSSCAAGHDVRGETGGVSAEI